MENEFIDLVDVEAEQMTLAALLKNSLTADKIIPIVNSEDFSKSVHIELFTAIKGLINENRFDFNTLKQWLKEKGKLDDVGGLEYIGDLRLSIPTLELVNHYAEKVRSKAILRRGLQLSDDIREMTLSGNYEKIEDYVAAISIKFNSLQVSKKGKLVHISQAIKKYIQDKLSGIIIKSPITGFGIVDKWMRGIGRNRLIIVAGRPGAGKTAFAMKVLRNVSRQEFGPVPFFSCEMEMTELIDRMVADITGIPFLQIMSGELNDIEKANIQKVEKSISELDLLIDDTPRMDLNYISTQCRKLKRDFGSLGVVAVDYLGLLETHIQRGENKSDAIGRITKEFKNLTRELGCSIMLLVQMNREIEKRATKRPVLSDLRDSGSIEQDADMVIFLHKDEEKSNANMSHIDLIVAKGRQTGVADFELHFYGSIQRMVTAINI